ncbi:hypothetical protein E6C64_11250 [Naasia lichenicola]|uniref:Uncharacterized protein n=1 Tax=Naasia lichenicola TaxID=2565933 RepID=A0A4S4FIK5_9MICO|nr:hypothetical protein E6C64_11250 [Naasia lichenicola]
MVVLGPTTPQSGVSAPSADLCLPQRSRPSTPGIWWLGTHGGAGESTLASVVPGSQSADHAWPITSPSARVMLIARSNLNGLLSAQRAATDWASGSLPGVDLVGLLLVEDSPGRSPRGIRDLERLVGGGVPRVWTLPWVESWRAAPASAQGLSPRVRRSLALLPVFPVA